MTSKICVRKDKKTLKNGGREQKIEERRRDSVSMYYVVTVKERAQEQKTVIRIREKDLNQDSS